MNKKKQYTVYLLDKKYGKQSERSNSHWEEIFLKQEKKYRKYLSCKKVLKNISCSLDTIIELKKKEKENYGKEISENGNNFN